MDSVYHRHPFVVPNLVPLEDCQDFAELLDDYTSSGMSMGRVESDTVVNYKSGSSDKHTYMYGEPFGQQIQKEIQSEVEKLTGLSLKRSYVSFRKYLKGNALYSLKDRARSEVSVTVCIGKSDSDYSWPIYIDDGDKTSMLSCDIGDGIIYAGTVHSHSREPLEIDWYSVLLIHYVNANGPYVDSQDRINDLNMLENHTGKFS